MQKTRCHNWGTFNDPAGFACAITFKDQAVLQLNPGTVINEKYLTEFVKMLNKKQCNMNIEENHGKRA